MTPCESWPTKLAPTSESATNAAMSAGVPAASKIAEVVRVSVSAGSVSMVSSSTRCAGRAAWRYESSRPPGCQLPIVADSLAAERHDPEPDDRCERDGARDHEQVEDFVVAEDARVRVWLAQRIDRPANRVEDPAEHA